MKSKQNRWDIPYHEAFFKASHNSYEQSIKEQLDNGVRGLEYDIHDDKIQELDDFEVYHLKNHPGVLLNENGNPSNYLFSEWLQIINDWSNDQQNDHSPITLFIELKDNIVDLNNTPEELYGIIKLNMIIENSVSPRKLYAFRNFRENNYKWPIVRELKGKVIIVLTSYWGGYWASSEGGFESRLKYLKNCMSGTDDLCFVSWTQEDIGKEVLFMKEKTNFWKCNLEFSNKNYQKNIEAQRATRADYDKIVWGRHVKTYYKKNYSSGYRCNFPATDSWKSEKYDSSFPWSI
ncbi:MAG: hypothetical protein ACXAC5_11270 [Promethearchaeota archaeon]|jgi:hypothetical protein